MELTHEGNVDTAVDPQAIQVSPPKKLPISDNDPTRDITPRKATESFFFLALGITAVLVLLLATAMLLLR